MEQQTTNNQNLKEADQEIQKNNSSIFKLGIIYNETYREDLAYYNKELIALNDIYGDKLEIIVFGMKPVKQGEYSNEMSDMNILKGVNYSFIKPVSIVHYFKQLRSMRLNMIFIPLIKNKYNETSENYNKYYEAGLIKIPIITINIFPYNKIISDKFNGFIFDDKTHFVEYMKQLIGNPQVSIVGENAYQDIIDNYNYNDTNIEYIDKIFTIYDPKNQLNET